MSRKRKRHFLATVTASGVVTQREVVVKKVRRTRPPPEKRGVPNYRSIWRLIDGAVADTFANHPEYVDERKKADVRRSIVKRATGAVTGYLAEAKKGRSGGKASGG